MFCIKQKNRRRKAKSVNNKYGIFPQESYIGGGSGVGFTFGLPQDTYSDAAAE